MDINARRNWIDGFGYGDCVELTIDGDGRTEDYETLVIKSEWGAFLDIEGFDPENKEIIMAVESVLAEIKWHRSQSTKGRRLMADKIRPIVKDAFKVNELIQQFTEIDVPDGYLDTGSIEEVNLKYDDEAIIEAAKVKYDIASDPYWQDTEVRRDAAQLRRFIKKWKVKGVPA